MSQETTGHFLMSLASRDTLRRFFVAWSGLLPRPGDYLMVPRRAKYAYEIVGEPVVRGPGDVVVDVRQVALPLPSHLQPTIHRWAWHHRVGRFTGSAVGSSSLTREMRREARPASLVGET